VLYRPVRRYDAAQTANMPTLHAYSYSLQLPSPSAAKTCITQFNCPSLVTQALMTGASTRGHAVMVPSGGTSLMAGM
jgi:hypothetical protein